MKKLLVIFGPTATGKTDLAIKLAKKFDGELVACDSRQVYMGLDIGTGKLPTSVISSASEGSPANAGTSNELRDSSAAPQNDIKRSKDCWVVNGINIWMYDVVSPKIQYTVANYVKDAGRVIKEIEKRGKLPIIVGGTGLYLKALLEGLSNLSVPIDKKLRWELEKLSLLELQEKLKALASAKWEKLNDSDRQNPRRLLRAIELSLSSLRPRTLRCGGNNLKQKKGNDALKIGLTAPRQILYKNADLRVLDWISQGIINEIKKLRQEGVSFKRLKSLGLEYGVLADYVAGKLKDVGEPELVKIIQTKIHGYIRRQLTWFKKEKNVEWFDTSDFHYINNVEMLVTSWYYGHHDKKN